MVTQRERLIAQGRRQVLLWLPDQAVDRLKSICIRERCTQQELVERLILDYSGTQPETAADNSGGDSIDRLSGSVAGLSAEITQLGGSVRDYVETSEDRLSDIEARLSAVEATINTAPALPIPSNNSAPETPARAAPGGNEAPGKKQYNRAPDTEIEERRKLFLELHNAGNSTSQISHAVRAKGYKVGTSASEVDKYLRSKGLVPNRMRG